MKYSKSSPSQKVVSSVASFVSGTRLYDKPRPSTVELMLESRRIGRQLKNISIANGTGNFDSPSALTAILQNAWDTFIAYAMAFGFASLRLVLFFAFWGLLIMAVPVFLKHL